MGSDRKPGAAVRASRGADDLLLNGDQRAGVDSDLDEAGADTRALDPLFDLAHPAVRQAIHRVCKGVGWQEWLLVIAGVGEDMEVGGIRETAQHLRVAANVGGSAIDKARPALLADL